MSKRQKCEMFCKISMPNVLIQLQGQFMDSESLHQFLQTGVRHSKLNHQEMDKRKLQHCLKSLHSWKLSPPLGNLQNDVDAIYSKMGRQVLDPFMVNQFSDLFSRKCLNLAEQFLCNSNIVKTLGFPKLFGALYFMMNYPTSEKTHQFDWYNIAFAIDQFCNLIFSQKAYLLSKIITSQNATPMTKKVCTADWFAKYNEYWKVKSETMRYLVKDITTSNLDKDKKI